MSDTEKYHAGLMSRILLGRVQSAAWKNWKREPIDKEMAKGFIRTSSRGGIYR